MCDPFCRHDWNLLSTATPAINAWMQPGHRLMVAVRMLMSQLKFRVNSILACIMTEALDKEKIHMPARVGAIKHVNSDHPSECNRLSVPIVPK